MTKTTPVAHRLFHRNQYSSLFWWKRKQIAKYNKTTLFTFTKMGNVFSWIYCTVVFRKKTARLTGLKILGYSKLDMKATIM